MEEYAIFIYPQVDPNPNPKSLPINRLFIYFMALVYDF